MEVEPSGKVHHETNRKMGLHEKYVIQSLLIEAESSIMRISSNNMRC